MFCQTCCSGRESLLSFWFCFLWEKVSLVGRRVGGGLLEKVLLGWELVLLFVWIADQSRSSLTSLSLSHWGRVGRAGWLAEPTVEDLQHCNGHSLWKMKMLQELLWKSPHTAVRGGLKISSHGIRLLREEKGAIPLSANCFAVKKKEAKKQCFEE